MLDVTTADLIHKLVSNYYCGCFNFSVHQKGLELLTWDVQAELLRKTFKSERVLKFPVSKAFSRLFLKKLISQLQIVQEVHDDFYSLLCSTLSAENGDDDYYRHYVIDKDFSGTVVIKETNKMVVNGTTGMKTWDAAVILLDWILENKTLFENSNVLELGSGVGLTGIGLVKHCNTKSVILSDFHSEVLKTVVENIKINFPEAIELQHSKRTVFEYGNKGRTVGVLQLDWSDFSLEEDLVPDVVIGADIVYDPSILEPLCNVFREVFRRNNKLKIYIESVIRNKDTFAKFKCVLDKCNFKYEIIPQSRLIHVQWNEEQNKELIKIFLE